MIVDSSALLAILNDEPDAREHMVALGTADPPRISAATLLEASIVARPPRWPQLDALLRDADVVPVDRDQVMAAREAHVRYGRGSGSQARLNFGDCFSYALAKVTGEPLLFKGDDFTHTDIASALDPSVTPQ